MKGIRKTKAEYNLTYYETNKKKLIANQMEMQICSICDIKTSRSHMSRHRKSLKHINAVEKAD